MICFYIVTEGFAYEEPIQLLGHYVMYHATFAMLLFYCCILFAGGIHQPWLKHIQRHCLESCILMQVRKRTGHFDSVIGKGTRRHATEDMA